MGNAAAKEPSMEDILSSIRKIVSQEDEAAERDGVPPTEAEKSDDGEQSPPPAASFAKLAHQVRGTAARASRYEETAPASEAIADEEPAPASEAFVDEEADFNSGLGAAFEEDAEPAIAATVSTPNPQEPEMNSQADTMATHEPDERKDQDMSDTDAMAGPHKTNGSENGSDVENALVSDSTQQSVSDSFERMKRSVLENIDARMDALMRPMLSGWLDQNLPGIVERIVREEVEKLSKID